MAVNLIHGNGWVFGQMENFDNYMFNIPSSIQEGYKTRFQKYGEEAKYHTYRPPVYPVFLALVYKVFGVHPAMAKIIQLLMLTFVAGFLPLVGYHFWKNRGYVSGVIAGIIFLYEWSYIYGDILTEPIIIFNSFLVFLAYIYYDNYRNIFSALILGASLALVFLTKGSLWFIPFLFLGYILFRSYKNEIKTRSFIVPIFITFVIPVMLYSVFASIKTGEFVFVTTQGPQAILDGNNEKSIISGTWEPTGTTDPDGFYEKNRDLPTIKKVILFYKDHFRDIPEMVINKIKAGYSGMPFLFLLLILVTIEVFYLLFKKLKNNRVKTILLLGIVVYGISMYVFYNISLLILGTLLLYLITLFLGIKIEESLPTPFVLFFANSLIITIMVLGLWRYTMVIDMFFMLLVINYISILFCKIVTFQIQDSEVINLGK